MPKRTAHKRPSFIEQARKRRAMAAGPLKRESTQSNGVRLSRDGRRSIMNRSERRWTAYHEAAHAVVNGLLGIRFRLVTIVPSGHLLGRVERERQPIWRIRPARITTAYLKREILSLVAGGIAERLARRDRQASGLAEDLDTAFLTIACLPGSRTKPGTWRRYLEMHCRAERLVRRNWDVIDQVAETLIQDKTLSESQVLRIVWDEYRFCLKVERMINEARLLRAQYNSVLSTEDTSGEDGAVRADEYVVASSHVRALEADIRGLERCLAARRWRSRC